ncbi:hypothetical protein EVAR_30634_1 [Eumeta japonica]|uniref:Uncharacterized protein n=1 Tax=Eumeta variegata TaxID=151549 RepID=A0A4C1VPZ9_EUMVA|nr:hypothetical protein EVAR_30634_1 [Eumeta japonica]
MEMNWSGARRTLRARPAPHIAARPKNRFTAPAPRLIRRSAPRKQIGCLKFNLKASRSASIAGRVRNAPPADRTERVCNYFIPNSRNPRAASVGERSPTCH